MVGGEIFAREQQAWGCSTQENELGAEGDPSRGRTVSPTDQAQSHRTWEEPDSTDCPVIIKQGEVMRQVQGNAGRVVIKSGLSEHRAGHQCTYTIAQAGTEGTGLSLSGAPGPVDSGCVGGNPG